MLSVILYLVFCTIILKIFFIISYCSHLSKCTPTYFAVFNVIWTYTILTSKLYLPNLLACATSEFNVSISILYNSSKLLHITPRFGLLWTLWVSSLKTSTISNYSFQFHFSPALEQLDWIILADYWFYSYQSYSLPSLRFVKYLTNYSVHSNFSISFPCYSSLLLTNLSPLLSNLSIDYSFW